MLINKKFIKKINNQKIYLISFQNKNNYSIEFYNYGGYIKSIKIPHNENKNTYEDVILGYKNFRGFVNDKSYMNCIVGRVANRISNSSFILNKKEYKISSNISPHHLHGGKKGFNKKIWKIDFLKKTKKELSCKLNYLSKDKEEGFPGNLNCSTTYILNDENEFSILFNATTDQDTLVNFTNHNYWNFHGHGKNYNNIYNHFIKINAKNYCTTDKDLIPTGTMEKVKKTKFDFTNFKIIDKNILYKNGIDNNYCINDIKSDFREVAQAYSDFTKMGVIIYSNQPGLQLYTGSMMEDFYDGKTHKKYGKSYGFCLEPQMYPNSINIKNFKNPILYKGNEYNSKMIFKLKNNF